MRGKYTDGMSVAKVVKTCLSELIYGEPDLSDGRAKAAEILAKAGNEPAWTVRGTAAKFFQSYNWQERPEPIIPKAVREALSSAVQEIRQESAILAAEPKVLGDPPSDSGPPIVISDIPPWTGLRRFPSKEIVKRYPKHRALTWMGQDELRKIAVEVAFAVVPQELHTKSKLMEVAESLYESFKEWEEIKSCEKNT